MTALQIGLLVIVVFISVYTLVDRICRCIEHGNIAKAYSYFATTNTSLEEFKVGFTKQENGKM